MYVYTYIIYIYIYIHSLLLAYVCVFAYTYKTLKVEQVAALPTSAANRQALQQRYNNNNNNTFLPVSLIQQFVQHLPLYLANYLSGRVGVLECVTLCV